MFKSWQERYFVLDCQKKTLTYYSEASKQNEKGCYALLPSSAVIETTGNYSHPNLFMLTGKSVKGEGKADLLLSATSSDLRKKWMDAVKKAIKGEPLVDTVQRVTNAVVATESRIMHEIRVDLGLEKRTEGEVSMCQDLAQSCSACVIA